MGTSKSRSWLASREARTAADTLLVMAVEEPGNPRRSFDLNVYPAGLTVAAEAFHPTVLVGMRNRLRASARPRRLFDDVTTTARAGESTATPSAWSRKMPEN